jgi:hypothetical protein
LHNIPEVPAGDVPLIVDGGKEEGMGSGVTATCGCGLTVDIDIGGGMANFRTTCYFPSLCEACQDVVQVNLLARKLRCPDCKGENPIPYDDPRLLGSPGKNVVAAWNINENLGRSLALTDGTYFCPKCKNMSLQFRDSGLCWD